MKRFILVIVLIISSAVNVFFGVINLGADTPHLGLAAYYFAMAALLGLTSIILTIVFTLAED